MMMPRRMFARLRSDERGLALLEFALALPVLIVLIMGGTEIANYTITRQRVSQLALQIADNASRIGDQSVLKNRPISEKQINDLFIGAGLQAGSLDLAHQGRVMLSGLTLNAQKGQWLQWQRCYGSLPASSHYGVQGDGATGTSYPGIGPAGAKVLATANGPVVFAEVAVAYKPVISGKWAPRGNIVEIAAFAVRDDRDTSGTGVQNNESVSVSSC